MTRIAGCLVRGTEMSDMDLKRLMDPKTAVEKAEQALGKEDPGAVARLAAAILVREGLVAVARVLDERPGGAEGA